MKVNNNLANTFPGNDNNIKLPPALSDSRRGSKQHGFEDLMLQGSQIDNTLNTISVSSTIQRDLDNIQKKAVMRYNERKYGKAEELFIEALDILKKHYPETHPEIEKAKKSIMICQRKKMAP